MADRPASMIEASGSKGWPYQSILVVLVYVLVVWSTSAHFYGDTADYVDSIVARSRGVNSHFWEFGHLLWRPLGSAIFRSLGTIIVLHFHTDVRSAATAILSSLSWIAGLLSIFLLHRLISRICGTEWPATVATLAFGFSSGFLNFAETGCSYVPGLCLVIFSLYLLEAATAAPSNSQPYAAWLSGVALGGAVCFWVPYFLTVPAVLSLPLFLSKNRARQWSCVLKSALTLAISMGLAYGSAIIILKICHLTELRSWIDASSHGVTHISGIPRVLIGFPRSFIDMGHDGTILKRFLLHDPFNPVSSADVIRLSLWKPALFYLSLASILLSLVRSQPGQNLLLLFLISSIPVLSFAIKWQGGDAERYLPLYPFFFLGFGFSLRGGRAMRLRKFILLAFVGALAVTNVNAMSRAALHRQAMVTAGRVTDLAPLLKLQSRVVVSHLGDPLLNFNRDFPSHPANQNLHVYPLVWIGTSKLPHWRQDFASLAFSVWDNEGDIWLSRRLVSSRPRFEWDWVEGDDKRVSWSDLYSFASQLEIGPCVGGEDGFCLLLSSARSRQFLNRVTENRQLGIPSTQLRAPGVFPQQLSKERISTKKTDRHP